MSRQPNLGSPTSHDQKVQHKCKECWHPAVEQVSSTSHDQILGRCKACIPPQGGQAAQHPTTNNLQNCMLQQLLGGQTSSTTLAKLSKNHGIQGPKPLGDGGLGHLQTQIVQLYNAETYAQSPMTTKVVPFVPTSRWPVPHSSLQRQHLMGVLI